jgi:DeoR/GlpR family transcriptional regulator of sugar metabolism
MMPSERRSIALREIQQRGLSGIDELAKLLKVSRVTVHRILDELEATGLVRKERGGVRAVEEPNPNLEGHFDQRKAIDLALKQEIALKALQFVSDRDVIFLDASTTTYCFAEALITAMPNAMLTIVTNSPAVVWRLLGFPAYHVISTGGELDHRLSALTGPITLEILSKLQFRKAFISPNAVSLEGIMTPHSVTAEIMRCVLQKNAEITLMAESPKFNRIAPLSIAPLSSIHRIVTDSHLSAYIRSQYEQAGIHLV